MIEQIRRLRAAAVDLYDEIAAITIEALPYLLIIGGTTALIVLIDVAVT